jgi:hypothetical protein
MKIQIRSTSTPRGQDWQVCLDRQIVNFRSENEARAFVATLENRLQAPHHLPGQQQRAAG